jgi:hypothetical protein
MTRGTRIVAIEGAEPDSSPVPETVDLSAEPESAASDDWWEEPAPRPSRPWGTIFGAIIAIALVAGWTAAFVLANLPAMRVRSDLGQWTMWVRDWSLPVVLIGVLWLIAMRNSRREAQRFGETARTLGEESVRLEARLRTVNRELSLAREFISSQARDIESLGRVATERLSEHAERLSGLVQDNGTRLETIQTVSAAALDNMETLRSHLPVIASSAKDVTNNIGAAGRTANSQIEELIAGFNRLNQFGQASERQVNALRDVVQSTLAEFTRQTEQLDVIAEQRFAALAERGSEFRTQLDAQEIEALAAIRTRAAALGEELQQVRDALDSQEAESLTSLRSRLAAVRDESAGLVRALREGESNALDAWKVAIVQLEEDLGRAIAKVAEIDEKAMQSARNRLSELANEAEQLDARMAERDRLFEEEIERRQKSFEESHVAFVARLGSQLEDLDARIAERRIAQEEQGRRLIDHSETVAVQLDQFARKLDEVAELGGVAEGRVSRSLGALGEQLAASQSALDGTDAVIAQLTDGSVRLLELIQASVQHSSRDLPAAMAAGETKLAEIESRVANLGDGLSSAVSKGDAVADRIGTCTGTLDLALGRIEQLSTKVASEGAKQSIALDAMLTSLEQVRGESLSLAEHAQAELKRSIEELEGSARNALAGISSFSAESLSSLAARLGDESAAAIDQAMRSRAAEVAGQLELATANAAEISREAAVQLRDQLAKVNDLAAHLEKRVAQARARAEEQVDNDFARRVALITESLNSNAIDIARAMDSDVTDTAWAAYLKGDRGIFTRRAVRLLDAAESKAVVQLYQDDRNFREHVSHYIHDFEAMLRQLLSTRDGHALGVTILSSDMGKLYVALAQAIERLRN